jgi:D-galactose 1-dehydrogenase
MRNPIAIIGVGKIAQDQHVPALASSPDWELAATCSLDGSVEGVDNYRDLSDMLSARPDIGTVSLCVPPVPRFELAAAAIRAGRHVMLEKPPGATLTECRTLEAMAREAGVSIYATWHSREAPQVAPLKAWLQGKTLRRYTVTWKEDVRRWHPGQAWIWQPGGLGIFDPGINALSIVTEVLPDPIRLLSADLMVPSNCDTPIAAELSFSHPGGAEVTASLDFLKEGEQIWTQEVVTDEGTALLSEGGAKLSIDGVEQPFRAGDSSSLAAEYPSLYAKMAALVASGQSEMDLRPMEHVADACLLGRRISVEPFIE